jgi:hypothetical protein
MKFTYGRLMAALGMGVVTAVMLCLFARMAQATALTAERDTPQRRGAGYSFTQGSNVIYAGAMVAINSSGKAVAASDSASLKVVGRAKATQDNTGSSYSATRTIEVEAGVFRWENDGSFTDANIGDLAYVKDDQTVDTAANRSQDIIAGVIVDTDSSGVWVDTHDIGSQGAGSVTTLATSGAATLGSTLSVAGGSTLGGTTVAVTNNATVGGTLAVTGAITGSSTVGATGFKIGTVIGLTGIQTNAGTGYTNLWMFSGGILTNVSFTGSMP